MAASLYRVGKNRAPSSGRPAKGMRMDYILRRKWRGWSGYVILEDKEGERIGVVKRSLLGDEVFPVVDANGKEILQIRRMDWGGTAFDIMDNDETVGVTTVNYFRTKGKILLAEGSSLDCKRVCAPFETRLYVMDGERTVADIDHQVLPSVKGLLSIKDPAYSDLVCIAAYALMYCKLMTDGR